MINARSTVLPRKVCKVFGEAMAAGGPLTTDCRPPPCWFPSLAIPACPAAQLARRDCRWCAGWRRVARAERPGDPQRDTTATPRAPRLRVACRDDARKGKGLGRRRTRMGCIPMHCRKIAEHTRSKCCISVSPYATSAPPPHGSGIYPCCTVHFCELAWPSSVLQCLPASTVCPPRSMTWRAFAATARRASARPCGLCGISTHLARRCPLEPSRPSALTTPQPPSPRPASRWEKNKHQKTEIATDTSTGQKLHVEGSGLSICALRPYGGAGGVFSGGWQVEMSLKKIRALNFSANSELFSAVLIDPTDRPNPTPPLRSRVAHGHVRSFALRPHCRSPAAREYNCGHVH